MLKRNAFLLAAGAAIFALDASTALAQDTTKARPRSQTRIPVVKEAPGEVVPTHDTVTVYKTDTLTMFKRDTVTVTQTNTVTRYDTVTQLVPMRIRSYGGLYWGVAGGSSLPAANTNDSDHPGWRLEVPIGWDAKGNPFGLRLLGGYANMEPHSYLVNSVGLPNAQIMNVDGDVKLRLLAGTPHMLRVQSYLLGGASWDRYKNILEENHGQVNIGNAFGTPGAISPTTFDDSWHSGWGWNAGAGIELGYGISSLYLESRFNRFSGVNSKISQVPLVIGVSFY